MFIFLLFFFNVDNKKELTSRKITNTKMEKKDLWISDPMVLVEVSSFRQLYPNKQNSFVENINAIARLIIVFAIATTLITFDNNFITEALKYLVLLGIFSFVYIAGPSPVVTTPAAESFGNEQRFVDKGGIDSGLGNPNLWGGLNYKEKFKPEPRMERVGNPSYDERNIDLRNLSFFDKNIINLTSATPGFPATRKI